MNILKMGYDHMIYGVNCQDSTVEYKNIKMLCDGCSAGKHSEVGAKLFCKIFVDKYKKEVEEYGNDVCTYYLLNSSMEQLLNIVGDDLENVKNYASFTIFNIIKNKDFYDIYFCGDGYIILIKDNNVEYIKIDCGEYPEYLVYNICKDREQLKQYKDGVIVHNYMYNIDDYDAVGVASDGIRFIADRPDDDPLKIEFNNALLSGKDIKVKLFINKHKEVFKDDVSILL